MFWDHELIIAQASIARSLPKTTQRRDWRHYSKDLLCEKLSVVDWSSNASSVQESWNDLECKIINVVDTLIPIVDFHGDHLAHKPCPSVKRKLNLRNRLLKILKKRPTLDLKNRVKNLNAEIRNHFRFLKRK